MRREISLQGWLRQYWIAVSVVIVVICLSAQSYTLMALTERTEDTIQKNVHIVQEDIEGSLDGVDSFLYESLYGGTQQTLSGLFGDLHSQTDLVDLGVARTKVVNSLRNVLSWSDMVDFILVCTQREEDINWLEVGEAGTYLARKQFKESFEERLSGGESVDLQRYIIYHTDGGNYMLRIMRIDKSYLIVSVSQSKILKMIKYAEYGEDGIAFVAGMEGDIISSSAPIATEVLSLENEGKYITIAGRKYLQTGYVSSRSGYYFGILTPRRSIAGEMFIFYVVSFLVLVAMLMVAPFLFSLMNRYVGRPLNAVAGIMEQVAEGDLDITVSVDSHIGELEKLACSFNHMIGQIKRLKIEKYESELAVQKATMQYLQLQIKPHFYANMFNIVYSLAQRRDYDGIQKISTAIVGYSRYMFQDAAEMVELWREMEHVRNYLEIQKFRYQDRIFCTLDVPKERQGALVPPFIIESFVENSVKYAVSSEPVSRISVRVWTDEKKDTLFLEIRDNGRGYSEEILKEGWKRENDAGHIGLSNVYRRLKIVYDEKADMQVRNDNGAVTIIQIPYIAVDDMDTDEEDE